MFQVFRSQEVWVLVIVDWELNAFIRTSYGLSFGFEGERNMLINKEFASNNKLDLPSLTIDPIKSIGSIRANMNQMNLALLAPLAPLALMPVLSLSAALVPSALQWLRCHWLSQLSGDINVCINGIQSSHYYYCVFESLIKANNYWNRRKGNGS